MNHIVTSTSSYRKLAEEVIARMEYGNTLTGGQQGTVVPVSVETIEKMNPALKKQLITDYYGEYDHTFFGDGEEHHVFTDFDQFIGKNVILIGGTINPAETLELFHMACTIVEVARSLTIVVPYFGYSTMERRTIPGEIVKAEKNMHLLKSIPDAEIKNTFIFFDLHTEGLPYYLGADVRKFHIYTKSLVINAAKEISKGRDFVLGSVDTGRSKWIESLAKDMTKEFGKKIEPTIVSKHHVPGTTETEVTGHQGANPKGKVVIIYDDMVRTGGSVVKAAQLYRELGATEVHMICTHGLFPKVERETKIGLPEKVPSSKMLTEPRLVTTNSGKPAKEEKPVIDSLWTTDTHPNVYKEGMGDLKIQSIAGLVASTVKKMSEFIS